MQASPSTKTAFTRSKHFKWIVLVIYLYSCFQLDASDLLPSIHIYQSNQTQEYQVETQLKAMLLRLVRQLPITIVVHQSEESETESPLD